MIFKDRTGEDYSCADCVHLMKDCDTQPCASCCHMHSGYEPIHRKTYRDIFKGFIAIKQEINGQEIKAVDYRPFFKEYLPDGRAGIIAWMDNGDVLAYFPKDAEETS